MTITTMNTLMMWKMVAMILIAINHMDRQTSVPTTPPLSSSITCLRPPIYFCIFTSSTSQKSPVYWFICPRVGRKRTPRQPPSLDLNFAAAASPNIYRIHLTLRPPYYAILSTLHIADALCSIRIESELQPICSRPFPPSQDGRQLIAHHSLNINISENV